MKLLLASLAITLVSPLAQASAHTESSASKVLSEGQQYALNFQAGSFAALSRLDPSLPSGGPEEWNGTILADWSSASRSNGTHGNRSDWNPPDWNTPSWRRISDDDLGRVIEDDGWFNNCQIGPVPEVSSWMLLACGATAIAVVRVTRTRRI